MKSKGAVRCEEMVVEDKTDMRLVSVHVLITYLGNLCSTQFPTEFLLLRNLRILILVTGVN